MGDILTGTPPGLTYEHEMVREAWAVVWAIASGALVVVLGWMGLSLIIGEHLGRQQAGWREMVPRLVLVLVAAATSLWWCALVIDVADGVSGFVAVAQLNPPRRASRYFRHEGSLRSIQPDAFAILRKGGTKWPFFLEWERRAVWPATMAARIAPYIRYYSSHRPADDHGQRPAVLVVFHAGLAAARFLRAARDETARAGVTLPLWVSHGSILERVGPLGRAWRTTDEYEHVRAVPLRP